MFLIASLLTAVLAGAMVNDSCFCQHAGSPSSPCDVGTLCANKGFDEWCNNSTQILCAVTSFYVSSCSGTMFCECAPGCNSTSLYDEVCSPECDTPVCLNDSLVCNRHTSPCTSDDSQKALDCQQQYLVSGPICDIYANYYDCLFSSLTSECSALVYEDCILYQTDCPNINCGDSSAGNVVTVAASIFVFW